MTKRIDEQSDEAFAVGFDFLGEFEDAAPRERPRVLARWRSRYPLLRGLLTEMARDTIRDERMKRPASR